MPRTNNKVEAALVERAQSQAYEELKTDNLALFNTLNEFETILAERIYRLGYLNGATYGANRVTKLREVGAIY